MGIWVVAGLSLLVAVVALSYARRLSRRLDSLTQSYWELRYDYTRLRSQVSRLDPEQVEEAEAPAPAVPADGRRALTSAQAALTKSLARLATAPVPDGQATNPTPALAAEVQVDSTLATAATDDRSLAEQLVFLQKVSTDLGKVTEALAA